MDDPQTKDGQKTPPFYMADKAIMEMVGLSLSARWLWVVLRDMQGGNGHCWPGIRFISRHFGIARETVVKDIKTLESMKLITVDRTGGRGVPHLYTTIYPSWVAQKQATNRPNNRPLGGLNSEHYRPKSRPPVAQKSTRGGLNSERNETHITRPINEKGNTPLQDTAAIFDELAGPKVGFDDPLLDRPAELPPLVRALERLGTQRHMQGGWFAQRVHTASAEHGGDEALAKLLNDAADHGKTSFKEAMAWINARVNQKSFNEAKGNSDGNGHKIGRVEAPPGKYPDRRSAKNLSQGRDAKSAMDAKHNPPTGQGRD